MSCPWIVRAVALLLVLIGLQGGSLRTFDTSGDLVWGAAGYSEAVRSELRKSEGLPLDLPEAARPWAAELSFARAEAPRRHGAPGRSLAGLRLPAPTGPPRA